MCEYLRPVVALEWLKACCYCTDMITWISGNFIIGRNTEHDDSKELPVMIGYVEDMELSQPKSSPFPRVP